MLKDRQDYQKVLFLKSHQIISVSIVLFLIFGCSRLHIPENKEDINDPNRGPILLTPGELEYPYLAQKVELEGMVYVEIDIDTVGRVNNVQVIKRDFNANAVYTASGKYIYIKDLVDEPVINFYKQSKYLPAMKNGEAVNSTVRTGIKFKMVK